MSQIQDPNPDSFEALQRLLALKRHEAPPPGFFDRLPDQIMSRLEQRQSSPWETLWTRISSHPWFQPAVACSCTATLAVLFSLAFLNAGKVSDQPNTASLLAPTALTLTNHTTDSWNPEHRTAANPAPLR